MSNAQVATSNAQGKMVVHAGSSDRHARVVQVDGLTVHVVAVHKHIDDWCSEMAPLVLRDGEWVGSRPVTINHMYGIIKFPKGRSYERSYWSLDKFCKEFNITHVDELEWIYMEPGVRCSDDHKSPLQWDIENGNNDYQSKHALHRPEGHHYQSVITPEHPAFKEEKRKEVK